MMPSQPLLNPAQKAQQQWVELLSPVVLNHRLRSQALSDFAHMKMPMARDEDWKYTRLLSLWKQPLALASVSSGYADLAVWQTLGTVLVFSHGQFDVQQSTPRAQWPAGLQVSAVDDVAIEAYTDAFHALSVAACASAWQVSVDARVQIDQPIVIVHEHDAPHCLSSCALRVQIGAQAEVSLIEVQVGAVQGLALSRLTMNLGDNAKLTHYLHQDAALDAHLFAWRQVNLTRNARFVQRSLLLGGVVSRQQFYVTLAGENAYSDMAVAAMASLKQIQDVRTHTRHAVPHAQSMQLHRFALGGESNGVFHGDIVVDKGADKTDANMATNNLLLSPKAQANSKPQLEIYADDVRCTHGVTCGNLDEAQVFYLRARGIAQAQAKQMIAAAFVQAAIADVKLSALNDYWQLLVQQRMQSAE